MKKKKKKQQNNNYYSKKAMTPVFETIAWGPAERGEAVEKTRCRAFLTI
jgi:hypothetical protein